MTHFSLFTGIGGIDLAAEWAGFETIGQCEYADYQTKVLEKHWSNIPRWRDVRNVTIESIRERGINEITLLSGGFPCQPHSLAGKRRASADERDLWSEFARIICETKPKWVLAENVSGLLSSENGQFFGRILRDMDKMGYNVGWCSYGADTIGAVHKRERVFLIAHTSSIGHMDNQSQINTTKARIQAFRKFTDSPQNDGNTNNITKLQKNQKIITIRTKQDTRQSLARKYWRNTPGEYWTIFKSPFCGMDDGIPNRVDALKALGNAVVPQQVYPILKQIYNYEKSMIQEETEII